MIKQFLIMVLLFILKNNKLIKQVVNKLEFV